VITRDGEPGMSYVSQEAAYEVAVAEAAGDLRTGHEIRKEVVGGAYDRLGDNSLRPPARMGCRRPAEIRPNPKNSAAPPATIAARVVAPG
jgi:hypothetical protein